MLLRSTTVADADFILELFNTPKWHQYIGDRKIYSLKDAQAYIENRMIAQQKRLGYSTYTIIRKSDQKKLGTCGLYDREGIEGLDIGFALLPKFEGQGYAFEASRSLMHAAFHDFGLEQVSAITLEHNLASRKLLEKLGLQLVGKTCLPGGNEQLLLHRIDALYYNTTS